MTGLGSVDGSCNNYSFYKKTKKEVIYNDGVREC